MFLLYFGDDYGFDGSQISTNVIGMVVFASTPVSTPPEAFAVNAMRDLHWMGTGAAAEVSLPYSRLGTEERCSFLHSYSLCAFCTLGFHFAVYIYVLRILLLGPPTGSMLVCGDIAVRALQHMQ